jgi:hypothetical protein
MRQYERVLAVFAAHGNVADKDTLIMGIADNDRAELNCNVHRHGPAYRLSTYFYDARKYGYVITSERKDGKVIYTLRDPIAEKKGVAPKLLQITDQRPKVAMIGDPDFLEKDNARRAA